MFFLKKQIRESQISSSFAPSMILHGLSVVHSPETEKCSAAGAAWAQHFLGDPFLPCSKGTPCLQLIPGFGFFFFLSSCQHFKQLVDELQAKGVGTVNKALTESFKILREVRVGAGACVGHKCPWPPLHSSPPSGCCCGEQAGAHLTDPRFVTSRPHPS